MPAPESPLGARLRRRGWTPMHVAEVGVWHPEVSVAAPWIEAGVRATLVEPDPEAADQLRARFGDRPGVTLHQVAVTEAPGHAVLYRRGPSTFLSTVEAPPSVTNDGYVPRPEHRIEVPAVTFDQIDDGSIDLLCVDVEGAEWLVIRRLRSRPAVIAVETHGGAYRNPHDQEIAAWMREKGYVPWLMTWTDTVYVRPEVIPPSGMDRLRRLVMALRVGMRRLRKRMLPRAS